MRTVVITDGKYRSSIAAVRTLGRAGYKVVVTQPRGDVAAEPPVFSSRYVSHIHWFEGESGDESYAERLLSFLAGFDERPILLCVGAVSLNTVARHRERFAEVADFLIAPPDVLDALNDKEAVHQRCEELGIAVPRQYKGKPERYPVIIKPHCGEKFGLKASERYAVAHDDKQFDAHLARMCVYDPAPIVQEMVVGDGAGASLLLGAEGELLAAICHRRIREYPVTGGPSTCCESFYDAEMIDKAYRLLKSFGFCGMAMVEFKGEHVLEVNPRIWGSFPMTECTGSPFTHKYALAAAGEAVQYSPCDYKTGLRMRFLLNDTVAIFQYLRHGYWKKFTEGVGDFFSAKEALSSSDDPAPMRKYLKQYLPGR